MKPAVVHHQSKSDFFFGNLLKLVSKYSGKRKGYIRK